MNHNQKKLYKPRRNEEHEEKQERTIQTPSFVSFVSALKIRGSVATDSSEPRGN
jgi:hypothetical protein